MQQALQRHNAGTAHVIPIILKPCDWQGTPFSKLQVLPQGSKPITQWDDPDAAFLNVINDIRQALASLPFGSAPFDSAQGQPPLPSHPSTHPPIHASTHPLPTPSDFDQGRPQFSTYNPQTFTGRDTETDQLTTLLSGSCRVLAIVGMTGIGKTALPERVIANLMDTDETNVRPYYRLSLDDRNLTPDFASSGATLLRTLGEEPTLEDQKDPANLLTHILNRLCSHSCYVQVDSLERLLRGDEQEEWSEFCDPLWLDLLQQFLASTHGPSQLLLTSQDIPGDLDTFASRYPEFWHCEPLHGLNPDEQQALFQKLGLGTSATDQDYLRRIGDFYDGHPLVLQVIADEIRQVPFQGNISRYWHHYEAEFTASPTPKTHKLSRSRLFRRRVRQRVEQSLQSLPDSARQMLCASAVFRRPVPVAFWHAMLPEDANPQAAFDALQDRLLVEFDTVTDETVPLLIRQHNLIRSVAYDQLKADTNTWSQAERQAAHLWLTAYEPAPDESNLETIRGYLEAFDHYCEVDDWEKASEIYTHQSALMNWPLHVQLLIGGHYKESIGISRKLADKGPSQTKRLCLNQLGDSYKNLGDIEASINYYRQSLHFTRETEDRQGEGKALGNLGIAYDSLGRYEEAIEFHRQNLTIAQEIRDRQGEGIALNNLGIVYGRLKRYEESIELYQQYLAIAQETRDRRGEGIALGCLGNAYYSLGRHEQAIDLYQQYLAIAQETRDRRGEGIALTNLGATQLKLEQYLESLTKTQAALEVFQEIGDKTSEAEALKNLAEVHQALGEGEVARQYCQQALALATELGIPLQEECEALQLKIENEELKMENETSGEP